MGRSRRHRAAVAQAQKLAALDKSAKTSVRAFGAYLAAILRYSARALTMTSFSISRRYFSRQFFFTTALIALVALAFVQSGCARRVGDGCTLDTDCSINNDRRCDLSQQGGYCTIAECDRNSCPDDSLCIEFFAQVDPRTRRFCMAPCSVDGDCRANYRCVAPDVQGVFTTCLPNTLATAAGCTRLVDDRDRTGPGTPKPRTKFCALPSPQ